MGYIRGIPDVEVELIEDMKIRSHNEINSWDSMRRLFNGYVVPVGSPKDVSEAVTRDQFGNNFISTVEKKNEGIPLTMRRVWRVSTGSLGETATDLVVLGPYVILRPSVPLDTYHSRLLPLGDYDSEDTYSGNKVNGQGRSWERTGESWDGRVTTSSWYEKAGETFLVDSGNMNEDSIFEIKEHQELESPNHRIHFAASSTGPWVQLESQFVLRKNQPFSILAQFGGGAHENTKSEVAESLRVQWENVDNDAEDPYGLSMFSELIPENRRLQPAVIVEFGNGPDDFCLVFHQDQNVILYQLDKETMKYVSVDAAFVGGANNKGTPTPVCIYPYGTSIYVFPTTAIPEGPGVIDAKEMKLDRRVQLGEGKMLVTLYGGSVDFGFCPVTHAWAGYIESPDILIPFVPETFEDNEAWGLIQCIWHGKNGTAAYEHDEELSPPDEDEQHPEEISHLKETFIRLRLYEKFYLNDGTDVTDDVVESDEDFDRILTFYNCLLRGANDETYVKQDNDDNFNTDEIPFDDVIYSPGVSVLGVTYIPGDVEIHMPASPKISKNDTVHVSVAQSVEQSQAEFTLNNRKPRDSGPEEGAGAPDNDPPPLGRGDLPESENEPWSEEQT